VQTPGQRQPGHGPSELLAFGARIAQPGPDPLLDQRPLELGQKDLMRHADIKTTMNVYGKAMAEPMREANSEVVRLVIQ
jgi:hypothetical protein